MLIRRTHQDKWKLEPKLAKVFLKWWLGVRTRSQDTTKWFTSSESVMRALSPCRPLFLASLFE